MRSGNGFVTVCGRRSPQLRSNTLTYSFRSIDLNISLLDSGMYLKIDHGMKRYETNKYNFVNPVH